MEIRGNNLRRRDLLAVLGMASGLALSGTAVAACFDMTKLPDAGMRKTLNFKPVSTDPKKSCSGCAFFTRTGQSDCGKCVLLSGGPVAAESVCDSWAAKG